MRKIYFTLTLLIGFGSLTIAQAPANRSVKTIVTDVLAQMPASQPSTYTRLMEDLSATGQEGVFLLIDRLQTAGTGNNSTVEGALSGLTRFVMTKGNEEVRRVIARAYAEGLEKVEDGETKAFLIRQLQEVGKDESVEILARYLNDETLCGPASRALVAIGTEKAGNALLACLRQAAGTPANRNEVLMAVAQGRPEGAEEVVRGFLGSADPEICKNVWYALSRVGSAVSLKDLALATARAGYTAENTGATMAYIALIKRIAVQGEVAAAEKAAKDLLKNATKARVLSARIAAVDILFFVDSLYAPHKKSSHSKWVSDALKDPDREYGKAVLNIASGYADEEMYIEVIKAMAKAGPEVKVDILNWLAREAEQPSKQELIRKLDIRFDLPARQVLVAQLDDGRKGEELAEEMFRVKEATVWALVKIGDPSFIPVLARLLANGEERIVLLAQKALSIFPGDIDAAVAKAIPVAENAGKIAGVELLALRRATANVNTVLQQLRSDSPEVKAAAYAALKDVVGERDLVNLCGMLETADALAIPPLQRAVISSLSGMETEKQVAFVTRRMLQAGDRKKHLYYGVLASTGDSGVLKNIVKDFYTGQEGQQKAAFEALLHWPTPEATDILWDICRDSSLSSYFEPAFAHYVEWMSDSSFRAEKRLLNLRKAMNMARTAEQKIAILKQIEKTGSFLALLYAGEFLKQEPLQQAAANAVMNIALNHPEYAGTNVRLLLERVTEVLDNPDAACQKEAIKKYLDEMPEGEGFVSIFNGEDLTGWQGQVSSFSRSKMKPAVWEKERAKVNERVQQSWHAENGVLVFDGPDLQPLWTVQPYGDFELYVDWKLEPEGQVADAGICLRGIPLVEIRDVSHTGGEEIGSGGIRSNRICPGNPSKAADNKKGEWNSFYIKMVGDRVTVVLNGEKVVDNVTVENSQDRKSSIPLRGALGLQAAGNKISFRNLYIKEWERKEPCRLSAEDTKEDFQVLSDGTNMHGQVSPFYSFMP